MAKRKQMEGATDAEIVSSEIEKAIETIEKQSRVESLFHYLMIDLNVKPEDGPKAFFDAVRELRTDHDKAHNLLKEKMEESTKYQGVKQDNAK